LLFCQMAQTSATWLKNLHKNGRLSGTNHQMSVNTMLHVVQIRYALRCKMARQNAPA